MKNKKSHFGFSKQEQSGVFYLLLFLVIFQLGYYLFKTLAVEKEAAFMVEKEEQAKIEELKLDATANNQKKLFPYNPNFISDYKGYTLGMSPKEIDRLHLFRQQNKYVNSAEEFQQVTKISDSLLQRMKVYFKFPEWKNKTKITSLKKKVKLVAVKDINGCTAEDLQKISGVGQVLSNRILKFRNALGGFVIDEQLYEVYGLTPEVANLVLKEFQVLKVPQVHKISLNKATVSDLSKSPYITKKLAYNILRYRELNDSILSFNELSKIEGFPHKKIERITLYFTIK